METDANRLKLTSSVTSSEPGGNVVVVRRFTEDRDKFSRRRCGDTTMQWPRGAEPVATRSGPVQSNYTADRWALLAAVSSIQRQSLPSGTFSLT